MPAKLPLRSGSFTIYRKGEVEDLTPAERRALKSLIKAELEARRMR